MAALVEVHNRAELDMALACQPLLVGINNRDLHDFTVRLETTLELRRACSGGCLPGCREWNSHPSRMWPAWRAAGVDAILVGEALVAAPGYCGTVRQW